MQTRWVLAEGLSVPTHAAGGGLLASGRTPAPGTPAPRRADLVG